VEDIVQDFGVEDYVFHVTMDDEKKENAELKTILLNNVKPLIFEQITKFTEKMMEDNPKGVLSIPYISSFLLNGVL